MPAAPDFPPAPDAVKPARALISLSDKAGLEAAARALHDKFQLGGEEEATVYAGTGR